MSRKFLPSQAPGQAATAPWRMLSDGSGTTEDSLTANVTPTPWQCGQAPAGVLAEKASESSLSAPSGYVPTRENSIRRELESVVRVPTEERDEPPVRCCCRATAGGSPVTDATRGTPACWIRRRA